MRANPIVQLALMVSACAGVKPPSACMTDRDPMVAWRRLPTAPVDAAKFRHVLSLDRGNDAKPLANEAWFASTDGRLMVCEVPAPEGCDPWHATFVQSALGWETEAGVMVADRKCTTSVESH